MRANTTKRAIVAGAAFAAMSCVPSIANAAPCPAGVITTTCEVGPGQTINVNVAGAIGINASTGADVTAAGDTINLAAANTTGAFVQGGGLLDFGNSRVTSVVTVAANGNGQTGLTASGNGSLITASGAIIDLTPRNAANTADLAIANMVGARALAGGDLDFTNVVIATQATVGAVNAANHGLVADGDGSTINFTGGSISALIARGSFGAFATNGGDITLDGGATVTTTGAQVAATAGGSHALYALGAGSTITGDGAIVLASGGTANGARAEGGGVVDLTGGSVTTSGPTQLLGGVLFASHGLYALGPDSTVNADGVVVSTSGVAANGARAEGGGIVNLTGGSVTTNGGSQTVATVVIGAHGLQSTGSGSEINATGVAITTASTAATSASGVFAALDGAVTLTDSTITVNGTGGVANHAAGVRINTGGDVTMTGGSVATFGQWGHGFSIDGAGSTARITGTEIDVNGGNRSFGLGLANGASAIVDGMDLFVGPTASSAINLTTGSTLTMTDSVIHDAAPTGSGLVVQTGSTANVTGGSITTDGVNAAGVAASNTPAGQPVILTNVAITTHGPGNAMGVVADINARIEVNGGTINTTGDATDLAADARRPIGLVTRNPGGELIANGTIVNTLGLAAMGAVADDGPSMTLTDVSITTQGVGALGLFAVVEQVGPQFDATLTANTTTVETFGLNAWGANVDQSFLEGPARLILNDTTVTTHGENAIGFRAIRGATGVATGSEISTEGVKAHGVLV